MSVTRSAAKPATPARRPDAMTVFVWEGTDKRGVTMKGEQAAKNPNFVRAELRKQGITPKLVKPKPKPLFGGAGRTISPLDIAIFSRQIATMMKAGVPIVGALEIIASGNKNPKMQAMVNSIRADVESGSALSEAISRHPVQFDELYRNLVQAGESAGVLETVLDTVATYKENLEALKGKIKKAMFYPAAVIAVALVVAGMLLVFVIPQFEEMFASFGADLPAFTKLVIAMSDFLLAWWLPSLVFLIAGTVGLVAFYKRSAPFRYTLDKVVLRLPVIGEIMHNSSIARFSRTLAVTFKAGVPLVEALDTVAGATGNQVYEKAVYRIRDDVAVG